MLLAATKLWAGTPGCGIVGAMIPAFLSNRGHHRPPYHRSQSIAGVIRWHLLGQAWQDASRLYSDDASLAASDND